MKIRFLVITLALTFPFTAFAEEAATPAKETSENPFILIKKQTDKQPAKEQKKEAEKEPAKLDVEIVKVNDNLHMLISPMGGNVAVSTGEDGTFIIDDQLGDRGEVINKAIHSISDEPLRFILNTHYHFDHTGNNEFFGKEKAIIVAQDNVRKRLSTDQFISFFKKKQPAVSKEGLPVVTFSDGLTINYNGDNVKIIHIANAHTDGDSVAYFRNQNVIVSGDIVFNGKYPFFDTEHGGSIKGMIAATDRLLGIGDADTKIIPGHGPLMNKKELGEYRNMLQTITQRVEDAIKEGKTLEETIESKPNSEYDEALDKSVVDGDAFITLVYNDLKKE